MTEDSNVGKQPIQLERAMGPKSATAGERARSDVSPDKSVCAIDERVAELREIAQAYLAVQDEATSAIREQRVDRQSIEEYFARLYGGDPLDGHIATLS